MPGFPTNQFSTQVPSNGVNNTATSNNQWVQPEPNLQDSLHNGAVFDWSYSSPLPVQNIFPVPMTTGNGSNSSGVIDEYCINGVQNVNGIHNASGVHKFNHLPQQTSYVPPNYTTYSNPISSFGGHFDNGSQITPQLNQAFGRPNWQYESTSNRCSNNTAAGGAKKQKRIRTAFTSQQMMQLEQEYAKTRYLERTRRKELADSLNLKERTLKIWFQNRRMKEKKDRAESLQDAVISMPSANIQMPMHTVTYPPMTNRPHYETGDYLPQNSVIAAPVLSNASAPDSMPPQQYLYNLDEHHHHHHPL